MTQTTTTTQAQEFYSRFGYEMENNGFTSQNLERLPLQEEAEEIGTQGVYCFKFPDGSLLFYSYNGSDMTWEVHCR